jgi:hypothetical protein
MADVPQKAWVEAFGRWLQAFWWWVVLSLGTDAALHAAGAYPALGKRMSDSLFVVATVYRMMFGILGS